MKITINKNLLENIISNFQPFLEKRNQSEITSHILIKTEKNNIIIKATDYDIGIMTKISSENFNEDEEITVNGKELLNIIKNLRDDKIIITNNKNDELEIQQNKTKITLPSFISKNYPEFPKNYENSKINIDSNEIINSLKKIFPVIDINNSRMELRNSLIDIKEYKFNFVATDTKRLEIISFNNPSVEKLSFMIPRRAIIEIQKFFTESANIYLKDEILILENEKYLFYIKIPNGNFLDYERVIPKDNQIKYKIHINKEKTIESLKIINSISKKVKIIFTKDKIVFEAISDTDSKAITEIDIDKELNKNFLDELNENIEICVLSQHILEYIKNIDTKTFEFGINENKNSACLLKSENFILIVIPTLI